MRRWAREDEWLIQFFHGNFVKVIVHNKRFVAIPRLIHSGEGAQYKSRISCTIIFSKSL